MNTPAARAAMNTMELAMRDIQQRIKDTRSILSAPPDPKPRHRRNLLSWRMTEISDAVDLVVLSRQRLDEAMGAEETTG